MFAPPERPNDPDAGRFIALASIVSDDGNFALVEFVATDRSAFSDILANSDARVKKFEKGKVKREDVEKEFRKFKRDVDLRQFGAIAQ